MNSALTPAGVFFVMSGLSLCAAFFIRGWIRETRGLTDKEKRSVFQDHPQEKQHGEAFEQENTGTSLN